MADADCRRPGAESLDHRDLLCPSAQPDTPGVRVIGVVDHTKPMPEVAYLDEALDVTDAVLELAGQVRATELFRFAAPCQTTACRHWDGADCGLVDRIVELVPVASLLLPNCRIRPDCRWYAQSGKAACRRCSHIVTQNEQPTDEMRIAATPGISTVVRAD